MTAAGDRPAARPWRSRGDNYRNNNTESKSEREARSEKEETQNSSRRLSSHRENEAETSDPDKDVSRS